MDKETIKIEVLEADEIELSNGDIGYNTEVKVDVKNMTLDRAVGIIMSSYVNIAEDFLSSHPEECEDCNCFKMHTRILSSIKRIHKEYL